MKFNILMSLMGKKVKGSCWKDLVFSRNSNLRSITNVYFNESSSHNNPVYQLKQLSHQLLKKETVMWSLTIHVSVQLQSTRSLLVKTKNFHFINTKFLTSCQKCVSILTGGALVRVIQTYIAVVGVWCIGNTKIMACPKGWPIATAAIDSISFCPSSQWHLCW